MLLQFVSPLHAITAVDKVRISAVSSQGLTLQTYTEEEFSQWFSSCGQGLGHQCFVKHRATFESCYLSIF